MIPETLEECFGPLTEEESEELDRHLKHPPRFFALCCGCEISMDSAGEVECRVAVCPVAVALADLARARTREWFAKTDECASFSDAVSLPEWDGVRAATRASDQHFAQGLAAAKKRARLRKWNQASVILALQQKVVA